MFGHVMQAIGLSCPAGLNPAVRTLKMIRLRLTLDTQVPMLKYRGRNADWP